MRQIWLGLAIILTIAPAAYAADVGIEGTRFTIDKRPAFLLGCSYYAGLGAPDDFVRADLDDLKALGFNWIRVWATWAAFGNDISALDGATGEARPTFMDKLRWLISECDKRGMLVDVTLSRGNGATGPSRLAESEAQRTAVATLVTSLKSQRNWWLDLSNERNIRDRRYTGYEELKELRALLKQIDSRRLVTASHAGMPSREDIEKYLKLVEVDLLSIHLPREAGTARKTAERVRQIETWMKEVGRPVPVHCDEPFRRGYGKWQPVAQDFIIDLKAALESSAAGWCFHNGSQGGAAEEEPRRSFDLRKRRLFDQLDDEERKFVQSLRAPGDNR